MIYMMGKPVKTAKPAAPVVVPVVSKAAPKARIQPVRPADVYDIRDVARAGASDISVREVLMSIKQDLRDFIECYFPASKFKRAWQNAIAFFAPEDAKVELEALDYTIADLERQRRIIGLQLSFLRLERARKMQEIK